MLLSYDTIRAVSDWFIADHWLWTAWGLAGQALFTGRFVLQWWVSEKLGKSVIPVQFWYFSLFGGIMIFIYSLHVTKLPFILGSVATPLIAWRNLRLIRKHRQELAAKLAAKESGTEILDESVKP